MVDKEYEEKERKELIEEEEEETPEDENKYRLQLITSKITSKIISMSSIQTP